jgi:hypothetical protein
MRKTKRSQGDNDYKVTPAKRMRPVNINDQGRRKEFLITLENVTLYLMVSVPVA